MEVVLGVLLASDHDIKIAVAYQLIAGLLLVPHG
jgi:hypothetical protein